MTQPARTPGGQGALGRGVPRVRRLHPAAQRQVRAYAYCKACHPGAIDPQWTRERVLDAMLDGRSRYGRLPSSYDCSASPRAARPVSVRADP
jgi:hypothetical protein